MLSVEHVHYFSLFSVIISIIVFATYGGVVAISNDNQKIAKSYEKMGLSLFLLFGMLPTFISTYKFLHMIPSAKGYSDLLILFLFSFLLCLLIGLFFCVVCFSFQRKHQVE